MGQDMGKKRSLYIILAVSLLVNCIFLFAGCSGWWALPSNRLTQSRENSTTQNATTDPSTSSDGKADASKYTKEIQEKLNKIDQVINAYYLNDTEIDEAEMLESMYTGYVNGLGERYSTYYSAQEYTDLMESSSGEYSGIGVSVSQNMNTGIITVVNPFENGPGYEAGIRKEDILYEVEGEEVTGQDINQVVAKIKGESGTTVNLTMYRPSTGEYLEMTVERRVVQNPTVTYEMKADGIGYIHITEFDEVTVEQFSTAIADLKQRGAKGLIFDVRDNPGGLLTSVCSMLDQLLPEGLLVYTMDKDGNREEQTSDAEHVLEMPMIVLTNGNSASAAEIFTAALQDYDWATVMGTTTYGKGIVQVILPLGDGSAVKVTQSKYYTPKGVCIHGTGVTPDIEVEYDREAEEDNQLNAALEQMEKMLAE